MTSAWGDFEKDAQLLSVRKNRCAVARFLEGLTPKDRQSVLTAFENTSITTSALHHAIEKRTVDAPSFWSVRIHRLGNCSCKRAKNV